MIKVKDAAQISAKKFRCAGIVDLLIVVFNIKCCATLVIDIQKRLY